MPGLSMIQKQKEPETIVSAQGIESYPDFPKVVVQVKDDEAELKTLKAEEKEW